MKKLFLKLTLATFLIPISSRAATEVILQETTGKTQFLAIGNPGFLKIEGLGKGPSGKLTITNQKVEGDIIVDLNSLDTGMGLRNRHMKEKYLKTAEYPVAILKLKDLELPSNWSENNPQIPTHSSPALLQIQNVSRPVNIEYTMSERGVLNAKFNIKITDFGIDIPSFMNVTVADNVNVVIESKPEIKGER